jgi:hypothetical protein
MEPHFEGWIFIMKKAYLLALAAGNLIFLLLIWSCDSSVNLTNSTESIVPPLPQLSEAQAMHIEDDWSGMNSIAPLIAHYDLVRGGDAFLGQGLFSIAGDSGRPLTDTQPITIPVSATSNFFNKLQQVKFQEGTYPEAPCCDNYPSLRIEFQLPTDKIVFFSTSPLGDFVSTRPPDKGDPWLGRREYTPWGLILKDRTYIVTSSLPAEAIATIDSYLRRDVWDTLTGELNKR